MKKIRKLLKNIIRCIIPFRILRHAIQEGFVLDYLRVLFSNLFKNKNISFRYNLSACLIVKDATRYLDEWINYHTIVGVDHFYIYDNGSTDNLKEFLDPYIKRGLVDYIYWPGQYQQSNTYNDCIKKHRFDTKWLTIIDDDEFIVPMKHKTILEVLDLLKPQNGLAMSWCMYGSNGYKKYQNKLVIERFKKHANMAGKKIEVKAIINPRKVCFFKVHHGFYATGCAIDENKKKLVKSAHHNIYTDNLIRVNHYFIKSLEECLMKEKRGDVARSRIVKYSKEWFEEENKNANEIKDDIMEKYVPKVKTMIKKIRG